MVPNDCNATISVANTEFAFVLYKSSYLVFDVLRSEQVAYSRPLLPICYLNTLYT
jgi:hypothetical protein